MSKRDHPPQNIPKTLKEKKDEFEKIVDIYLVRNPILHQDGKMSELEIRFGTNPKIAKPITKINYDNVVKHLMGCGFKYENPEGIQYLRIQNEYIDKMGQKKMSNIRAEIVGTDLIQEYCKTNDIQKVINLPSTSSNKIKFTQKSNARMNDGTEIRKVDMEDFNFRVSFQMEQDFHVHTGVAKSIINSWVDSKKLFRCLNRVRFVHPVFPIFADLSIIKSSKKVNDKNWVPIPQYTIQEAGVFNNTETYEIELEIDNSRVGLGTSYTNTKVLMEDIKRVIRIVLNGIQGTKYPISYQERDNVILSYMKLIHGINDNEPYELPKRISTKDFIGPSSFTLQLENIIIANNMKSSIPNIRTQYTVTDKADGERKLLFITNEGKIYLIDTNMNVIFTGTKTENKKIMNSLFDGEYIPYDKYGKLIQLYMGFDIYFLNKQSYRERPFLIENDKINEKTIPRLLVLQSVFKELNIISTLGDKTKIPDLIIKCKEFETCEPLSTNTIFQGCSKILSNIKDNIYQYNTDGLIFTPANLPLGGVTENGPPGPLTKSTWKYSFKWKPPQFNTIDFLVSLKKDGSGKVVTHNMFEDGTNLLSAQEIRSYKTLVLYCGYSEKEHGFINPFQDILDENYKQDTNKGYDDNSYKPVPFQPSDPYDKNACFCNIELKKVGEQYFMMTEENEYFEEDTIIEFKYDMTKPEGWRWTPIRVRYDKTAELNSGLSKNYGNAYHVANNNWFSIHHPISEEIISSGENIVTEQTIQNDIYYNRSEEETNTRSLRDFHNLFVKKNLIMAVTNRGDTLIDYAAGKGGDISKWQYANLKFVFGIDVSRDNIFNNKDGACVRYLKARRKFPTLFDGLFIHGDSGLNIRSGNAFMTEKDKQITKAIFGNGPKDATILGNAVYNNYGIANQGFNISSCQFALHYFFESKNTLHSFLRNIAECTRINGYFIGTCYDGKTLFNLLKGKEKGESILINKDGKKICEITKMYEETGFPEGEECLGYAIYDYQQSINNILKEYLVNFDYLIRVMEDYGFVLDTREKSNTRSLPNSTGLFSELYVMMENELKMNPKKYVDYGTSTEMSAEERRISFMYRYFIFRKVRNVDLSKLHKIVEPAKIHNDDDEVQEKGKTATEPVPSPAPEKPKKIIIRKKKVVLKQFEPIEEDVLKEITDLEVQKGEPTIVLKPKLKLKVKK